MLQFFKSKPKPFTEAFRGKLYPAMSLLKESVKEQQKTAIKLEADCQALRQEALVLQVQLQGQEVVALELLAARRNLAMRYRKLVQDVVPFNQRQTELIETSRHMLTLLGKPYLIDLFGLVVPKVGIPPSKPPALHTQAMVTELDVLVAQIEKKRTLMERLSAVLMLGLLVVILSD